MRLLFERRGEIKVDQIRVLIMDNDDGLKCELNMLSYDDDDGKGTLDAVRP